MEAGRMRLAVSIPANTEADVVLPSTDLARVMLDGVPLDPGRVAPFAGRPSVRLPSGAYEFVFTPALP
jgi:hypothetical protein